MNISKIKKYTHVTPTQSSFKEFFNTFKIQYSEFIGEHLIIDFSEKFNIKIEELVLFLELSVQHQENGTSFVIICNTINIDQIPLELSVAPTLTEAMDILEMDAIERDLGF